MDFEIFSLGEIVDVSGFGDFLLGRPFGIGIELVWVWIFCSEITIAISDFDEYVPVYNCFSLRPTYASTSVQAKMINSLSNRPHCVRVEWRFH